MNASTGSTPPGLEPSSHRALTPFEATALPSGPILRSFFNIAGAWRLDRSQTMALLGLQAVSTYSAWKREPSGAKLRPDTIERISYVVGIHAALRTWLSDRSVADEWVTRPNGGALFGGAPPIELMTRGYVVDLARVREHLDALVHGGH